MLSPLVFPLDQKALATDHRFQVIAVSGGGGGGGGGTPILFLWGQRIWGYTMKPPLLLTLVLLHVISVRAFIGSLYYPQVPTTVHSKATRFGLSKARLRVFQPLRSEVGGEGGRGEMSELVRLESELADSIAREDYTYAAELRDRIAKLRTDSSLSVLAVNENFYKAFRSGDAVAMDKV